MSLSSNGINFSGLGSGIDTDSIVSRLMQLEAIPVQRIQTQMRRLQQRMDIYGQLKTQISTLRQAAGALTSTSAFQTIKGTSSDETVAKVGTGTSNTEGVYSLKVFQLAQSQKLSSLAQTDSKSTLNLSGTFTIGGKEISVVASDTLQNIADKINTANGDVTASLINGGTGKTYLTLTSKTSGTANNVKFSDTTGNVLSTLGFSATSIRDGSGNLAKSFGADSADAKLNTFAGFNTTGATTVTLNGQNLVIDPTTDTLNTLKDKVNALTGVSATVVSATENGQTVYRLQIDGNTAPPTFGSESSVFTDLGFTKRTSELVAAKDAYYQLDTVNLRSASNTVSTAIPGIPLTFVSADSQNGKATTISLTRDSSTTKSNIQRFVDAYNGVADFISQNSEFNKDTFVTGPLFGDSTARQVSSELAGLVFSNVGGVEASASNLAQIGLKFGDKGKLTLDSAILDTAIASKPGAIEKIFRTVGTVTGEGLSFVSSTNKSVASGSGNYAINITQAASKTSQTSAQALSGTTAISETLTFSGAALGTNVAITLPPGKTAQQIADVINNDSRLKDTLSASVDNNGKLVFSGSRYGTAGQFSVISSAAAATDNSGIGTAGESTVVNGLDVAGTINGEVATGKGQFLTGNTGNSTTEGIQIMYTGAATGAVGSLQMTQGIASIFSDRLDSYTVTKSGLFDSSTNALQSQYDDLDTRVTDLQARMTVKEASLRAKFLRMEQAISAAQQQQQRFAAMIR